MKTYVAEVDGEAILVFRALDDTAAGNILCEEDGGFQLVARGYLAFCERMGAHYGTGRVQYGIARHHLRNMGSGSSCETREPKAPTIPMIGSFIWFRWSRSMTQAEMTRIGELVPETYRTQPVGQWRN
jgi:hypothetical protein